MLNNDSYTAGNLLHYSNHQIYYKVVGTNLSRRTNLTIPQQINFPGKLEDNEVKMFFLVENQQKAILNFF